MNDLSSLMRSRVDVEHIDLADLASRSIVRAQRIRRVRYAGAVVATAAVIAGVAIGAAALPAGSSTATELQPAAGRSLDVPAPATEARTGVHSLQDLTPVSPGTTGTMAPEHKPFRLTLAGWTCGPAADEKFDCVGPSDAEAHVVWRPARDYADWAAGTPDKQSDWVSAVHNDVFVTIDGDATKALGGSLVWK